MIIVQSMVPCLFRLCSSASHMHEEMGKLCGLSSAELISVRLAGEYFYGTDCHAMMILTLLDMAERKVKLETFRNCMLTLGREDIHDVLIYFDPEMVSSYDMSRNGEPLDADLPEVREALSVHRDKWLSVGVSMGLPIRELLQISDRISRDRMDWVLLQVRQVSLKRRARQVMLKLGMSPPDSWSGDSAMHSLEGDMRAMDRES